MKIKFKKLHENAVLPSYAKAGDAGLDLTAVDSSVESKEDQGYYYVQYHTGLAVEIPEGHVGLLFPRSSISKTALILANSVGVVDSGYRGEICLRFKMDANVVSEVGMENIGKYKLGDKIGQLMIVPYPTIEPEFSEELSSTERGAGGFGSSGA